MPSSTASSRCNSTRYILATVNVYAIAIRINLKIVDGEVIYTVPESRTIHLADRKISEDDVVTVLKAMPCAYSRIPDTGDLYRGLIPMKLDQGLGRDKDLPVSGNSGVGNKAIALKNCHNVILRDFSILQGGWLGFGTGVDNFTIDNLRLIRIAMA